MISLPQYGKKIIATLLLGTFVFIHAEKILHEHSYKTDSEFQKKKQPLHLDNNCKICDFQLGADVDVQLEIISSPFNYPVSTDIGFLLKHYFNNTPSRLTERGPPAIG